MPWHWWLRWTRWINSIWLLYAPEPNWKMYEQHPKASYQSWARFACPSRSWGGTCHCCSTAFRASAGSLALIVLMVLFLFLVLYTLARNTEYGASGDSRVDGIARSHLTPERGCNTHVLATDYDRKTRGTHESRQTTPLVLLQETDRQDDATSRAMAKLRHAAVTCELKLSWNNYPTS